MKKYYCPTCKRFKHRWQLKMQDDTRVCFLTCRWCHNRNIYSTEEILNKLVNKCLTDDDF